MELRLGGTVLCRAAQQGTTGGGVQNVPIQFSTATGTIVPAPDGVTTIFVLTSGILAFGGRRAQRRGEDSEFLRLRRLFLTR